MSTRITTEHIQCDDKVYHLRLNTREFKNGSTHIVVGINCDSGVSERAEGILGLRFTTIPEIEKELSKRIHSNHC